MRKQPWRCDIAIMVLREKIKFSPSIGPICLPSKSSVEAFQQVIVAGWGTMRTTGNDVSNCATDQYGPSKFRACIGEASEGNGCYKKKKAPSHKECKKFLNTVTPPSNADIAKLENGVTCSLRNDAEFGWCYTNKVLLN